MATPQKPNVNVPPELLAKFPEVVPLIMDSESMNDEERQYWINILPIMTPEQIQNLKTILDNEKKQLAAIDQKYQKEISQIGQDELLRKTEEARHSKMVERQKKENANEQTEEAESAKLLNEISNM